MLNVTLQRIGQKFILTSKEELITLLEHFGIEWNIGYEDELALKEHLIVTFPAKRIGAFPFSEDTISCTIAFVRTEIVVHFLPSDFRNYGSLLLALEKEHIGEVCEELLCVGVTQEFEEHGVFSIDAFVTSLLPEVNLVSYDTSATALSEVKIFLADASDCRLAAYLENRVKELSYIEGKIYFTPYRPNENIGQYYFLLSLKQGKYISRLKNLLKERIEQYLNPSLLEDPMETKVFNEEVADLGYIPVHYK